MSVSNVAAYMKPTRYRLLGRRKKINDAKYEALKKERKQKKFEKQ
jgi:hypothetical protein